MASIKVPPKRLGTQLESTNDHSNEDTFQLNRRKRRRDNNEHYSDTTNDLVGHNSTSTGRTNNDNNDMNNDNDTNTKTSIKSGTDNDFDEEIDISSYNTPPPSSFSESRDRSLSPNESKPSKDSNATNQTNNKDSTTDIKQTGADLLLNDVKYIALCSAASLLRSQREMVKKDIIKLNQLKLKALADPDRFIKELGTKKGDIISSIPKQINIINGDLNKLFK